MARHLGRISRSLEQLDAIAVGVYPPVNLVLENGNREKADAMWHLRKHLQIVGWTGGLSLICMLACAIGWLVGGRRNRGLNPT
jgi:hypothetical protein